MVGQAYRATILKQILGKLGERVDDDDDDKRTGAPPAKRRMTAKRPSGDESDSDSDIQASVDVDSSDDEYDPEAAGQKRGEWSEEDE